MVESVAYRKSLEFAINIIGFYRKLKDENEYVISRQLLRSATSIGANITEAIAGESKRDFLHKLQIAMKEARETKYWLLLLQHSKLTTLKCNQFLVDVETLLNILARSIKTTKDSL